jgi:hypothetical protein
MKKSLLTMVALLATGNAYADEYSVAPISSLHVDSAGYASFGTTIQFAGTCSHYTDHFRFNANTAGGKNMLTFLLTAKVLGTSVRVWYTPSSTPGANQDTTCTESTMAEPTHIGIN